MGSGITNICTIYLNFRGGLNILPRLAAWPAAECLAGELGGVGEFFGYRVRLDCKVDPRARI